MEKKDYIRNKMLFNKLLTKKYYIEHNNKHDVMIIHNNDKKIGRAHV